MRINEVVSKRQKRANKIRKAIREAGEGGLESMTKDDLSKLAEDADVSLPKSASKDEMVDSLGGLVGIAPRAPGAAVTTTTPPAGAARPAGGGGAKGGG